MHDNERTIHAFYSAFQSGDAEAMAAVYGRDSTFSDPVFDLAGEEIGDMWRMLCRPDGDLTIEFDGVTCDDNSGSARWEARYTFPPTGRNVHNVIEAEFAFDDGLVVAHRDSFSLWKWSAQALGTVGKVFGWSPMLRRTVRTQAAEQLSRFRGQPSR